MITLCYHVTHDNSCPGYKISSEEVTWLSTAAAAQEHQQRRNGTKDETAKNRGINRDKRTMSILEKDGE